MMALFAIGDIHGCFNALKRVVETSAIKPGDTVVLLGDFISKGPDSKSVVDWIIQNQRRYHLILLRGNHEDMLIRSAVGDKHRDEWMAKGGLQVLQSCGADYQSGWEQKIPDEHWKLIHSTRRFWQYNQFVFVHAGVISGLPLEDHDDYTLYWRKCRKPMSYAQDKVVIYGHTALKDGHIADFGHSICLDTFAYGGMWLSCMNVHTREFWQASQSGSVSSGELAPHHYSKHLI